MRRQTHKPVNKGPISIKIRLPGTRGDEPWDINYPFLKLSLKYGHVGTWTPNWSLAFDLHSASRGPGDGPPSLADLAVTTLMNSRLRSADVKTVTSWLAVRENASRLEAVRKHLAAVRGLAELPRKSISVVGALIDEMIAGRELRGVRMAKVMNWFSAWAPAHIPMIDRHVYWAMTNDAALGSVPMAEVLGRFRTLLVTHQDDLVRLGHLLAQRLGVIDGTITPVRILDSLIWFDWRAIHQYASEFQRWVAPNNAKGANSHLVRLDGIEWASSQGIE